MKAKRVEFNGPRGHNRTVGRWLPRLIVTAWQSVLFANSAADVPFTTLIGRSLLDLKRFCGISAPDKPGAVKFLKGETDILNYRLGLVVQLHLGRNQGGGRRFARVHLDMKVGELHRNYKIVLPDAHGHLLQLSSALNGADITAESLEINRNVWMKE